MPSISTFYHNLQIRGGIYIDASLDVNSRKYLQIDECRNIDNSLEVNSRKLQIDKCRNIDKSTE